MSPIFLNFFNTWSLNLNTRKGSFGEGVSVVFPWAGFGAMKLGLKYPHLFQSMSSQSGLLDIELLKDKWFLKMVMPELLEVFGRFEAHQLPPGSSLDLKHIEDNNPFSLIKTKGVSHLPDWLYLIMDRKKGLMGLQEGNKNLEKHLKAGNRQIPAQPFNGKSGHNYRILAQPVREYPSASFRCASKTLLGK